MLLLIVFIAILCFLLGHLAGQFAQIRLRARLRWREQQPRQRWRNAQHYSENPLPDEQQWRDMLEKKQ